MAEPTLGERLMDLREERMWTQGELSEHSGVSPATINKIENGHIDRPRFGTVRKLAQGLGVEPEVLRPRERASEGHDPKEQTPASTPSGRPELEVAGSNQAWVEFINEWTADLEEWAYGFHKGGDPAELPERELLAYAGGVSIASGAFERLQPMIEQTALENEDEDLARAWRRLSRSLMSMVTPALEQWALSSADDDELPDNVRSLLGRRSA